MLYYYNNKPVFQSADDIIQNYDILSRGQEIYTEEQVQSGGQVGNTYQYIVGEEQGATGGMPGRKILLTPDMLPSKAKIGKEYVLATSHGIQKIYEKRQFEEMTKLETKGIATWLIILIIAIIIMTIMAVTALVGMNLFSNMVKSMIYGGEVETGSVNNSYWVKYPDGSSCLFEKETNKQIKCSGVPFFGGIAGIILIGIAGLAIVGVLIIAGPTIMNFIKSKSPTEKLTALLPTGLPRGEKE